MESALQILQKLHAGETSQGPEADQKRADLSATIGLLAASTGNAALAASGVTCSFMHAHDPASGLPHMQQVCTCHGLAATGTLRYETSAYRC